MGSEQKKAPMVDFCLTAILAVFWLAASAAWANGVINMKYAANPDNWIFGSGSICEMNNENYINTDVDSCSVIERGSFQKANISIIIGFCTRRRPGSLMDLNNSSSKLNSLPNLHFKCILTYLVLLSILNPNLIFIVDYVLIKN